jgi:hypothetical protein
MSLKIASISLFFILLWVCNIPGQTAGHDAVRLVRISYLTPNLDSMTRSFIKRGYRINQGKRDPGSIFNNSIIFPDGCQIILETTTSTDANDWRLKALKKFGSHVAGIAFEAENIDTLWHSMKIHNIPVSDIAAMSCCRMNNPYCSVPGFALDSCAPLDVVFIAKDTSCLHTAEYDSLARHPNHVFRFDWILLTASSEVEARMRKVFEIINGWKQHEGCCDFWRVGPSDDFCFFRFEPLSKKSKIKSDWLSIEPDGMYFAY